MSKEIREQIDMVKNWKQLINEAETNDNLSKYDKYKLLSENKPIIVYRGIHESGKNFYKGEEELPFMYFSLTIEKAEHYGTVNSYIFNEKSLQIKIFKGNDLFNKFGPDKNIEDKEVIKTLINEGYSAILIKGDELVVLDKALINNYNA
jgi:hypothetical protein